MNAFDQAMSRAMIEMHRVRAMIEMHRVRVFLAFSGRLGVCVCVCVVVSSVCVVVFGRSGRCGARPPGGPSGIRQSRWKGLLR